MGLAPVEVNTAYAARDVEELGKLHVDYCFNCGSCAFVCPAKRPCTQMMSLAKETISVRSKKEAISNHGYKAYCFRLPPCALG